jgi:hypothetical protein
MDTMMENLNPRRQQKFCSVRPHFGTNRCKALIFLLLRDGMKSTLNCRIRWS